ncbi:hypothetical protein I4U23_022136 [Adineta vaga]|nr:hypothetical protein I4U23_022136 [Adineta vaga]
MQSRRPKKLVHSPPSLSLNIRDGGILKAATMGLNIFYNGILSGLRCNMYIKISSGYSVLPVRFGNSSIYCGCRRDDTCSYPAFIYNDTGRIALNNGEIFGVNTNDLRIMFSLPNIKAGCFPYKSLLDSTFECFYDQSCLDSLQKYIPGFSLVVPLESSQYSRETQINDLLNNLLIESWNEIYNFSRYYEICSPKLCTYSYDQSFDKLYIITSLISLFGGLKIIFFFSAPYIARFLQQILTIVYCMALFRLLQKLCLLSNETITNEIAVFMNLDFFTTEVLANNTFQRQTSSIIEQFQQQTVASFYGLYQVVQTSIQVNQFVYPASFDSAWIGYKFNDSIRFSFTSQRLFDDNCSCAINKFCKTSLKFFCLGTCSGNESTYGAIVPDWFTGCSSIDSLSISSLTCFYNSSCIQMLIDGYSLGISGVTINPRVANITPLNSMIKSRFTPSTRLNEIISELFIEEWIYSINFQNYFQECSPNECVYSYEERFSLSYMIAKITGIIGGLSVALRILVPLFVKSIRRIFRYYTQTDNIVKSFPKEFNNNNNNNKSCLCTISPLKCFRSLLTSFNQTIKIPGIVFGCLPIDGLRQSTLECFYNSTCLNQITEFFNITNIPNVLNQSISSRFYPVTSVTIGQLIDELFIETWEISYNYSNYYSFCLPSSCEYSYTTRNSISYMLTTFLGLYGGLTVALKLFVWYGLTIYWKICQNINKHYRKNQVVSLNSN